MRKKISFWISRHKCFLLHILFHVSKESLKDSLSKESLRPLFFPLLNGWGENCSPVTRQGWFNGLGETNLNIIAMTIHPLRRIVNLHTWAKCCWLIKYRHWYKHVEVRRHLMQQQRKLFTSFLWIYFDLRTYEVQQTII